MDKDEFLDDETWFRESPDWPKSYQVYRSSIPIRIHAPSEEDARLRYEQFQSFLVQLGYFEGPVEVLTHDSMAYVMPEALWEDTEEPSLERIGGETFHGPDELKPSMSSGALLEWTWLRPAREGDYDPEALARQAFGFEDEDFG